MTNATIKPAWISSNPVESINYEFLRMHRIAMHLKYFFQPWVLVQSGVFERKNIIV